MNFDNKLGNGKDAYKVAVDGREYGLENRFKFSREDHNSNIEVNLFVSTPESKEMTELLDFKYPGSAAETADTITYTQKLDLTVYNILKGKVTPPESLFSLSSK